VVRKAFWRKGLATKFLTQLFKIFREGKYESVILGVARSNLAAIRLYQRLGFIIAKEDDQFCDMKLSLKELLRKIREYSRNFLHSWLT